MNNLELTIKKFMSPLYDLGWILILFLSFYNFLWKDVKSFINDKCSLSINDNNGVIALSIGINETHPEELTALEAFSRPTKCGYKGFEVPTITSTFEIDFSPKADYIIKDNEEILDLESPKIISCNDLTGDEIKKIDLRLEQEEKNEIYTIVEDSAMPIGGYPTFYKYLAKNLKYPKRNSTGCLEGRVYIQFIVEKDGQLSNFKIVRGINQSFNEAALEVLQKAPEWKPGKIEGKLVRQKIVIPVRFEFR